MTRRPLYGRSSFIHGEKCIRTLAICTPVQPTYLRNAFLFSILPILLALRINVFWDLTPCSLVEICDVPEERTSSVFSYAQFGNHHSCDKGTRILMLHSNVIPVVWNVSSCSFVERYPHFGRACFFHRQDRRVSLFCFKARYMLHCLERN